MILIPKLGAYYIAFLFENMIIICPIS